jgi:hypothetical protein
LKESVWVWIRFGRGRTSGMCEKFSRLGASSNRLADSAKAIQDSLRGRVEGMVRRGHANGEYITLNRFVN